MTSQIQKQAFLCVVSIFLLAIFLTPALSRAGEPLHVMVSIVPQKYFVDRIGGNRVQVSVLVPPGSSPHTYEPKPGQMVELARDSVYFAVGMPFEKVWLEKFVQVNPGLTIVHTEEGIEKLSMGAHHHEESSHQGEHEGIKDPHIWLSPPLVMFQARHILEALARVDPERKTFYETNYRKFIVELVDLDLRIKSRFAAMGNHVAFMVYHPSWGYFARSYGLKQVPIELEGKEPKAKELQTLIGLAQDARVKAIFVQPQYSTKSAQTIAKAVGAQVIIADPLAADWAENLAKTAEAFAAALK
jgi:zinc transport system substrate-binding protein